MNTPRSEMSRVLVEIRVRGEGQEVMSHEWAYLQVWDEKSVIDLLCQRLGKSEGDVRSLLLAYDRFRVSMTIRPEEMNYPLVDSELSLSTV